MISSHYEAAVMMDLLPLTVAISPLLQQNEMINFDFDHQPVEIIKPVVSYYE